jgi:hypothetical protein
MPLHKLEFRPGVNRESTTLANEGGWYASNNIRFRSGQAEKIGGWTKDNGSLSSIVGGVTTTNAVPPNGTFWGVCRSMFNWLNSAGYNLLGLGTNLKFYIQSGSGGSFYDVTPIRTTHTAVANAFTTFSTTQVRVNDPGHGAQTGDFVTISSVSSTVNGIPAASLDAEFQITYIDSNTYYITSPVTATSSGTPGVTATFQYQITTGSDTYTTAVGWGAGTWGGVVIGTASNTLNGGVNSSTSSITLNSVSGFTTSGTIVIDNESIVYSGISTNTLTGCIRGSNGTVGASHSNGAVVVQSTNFYGWGQAAPSGLGIGVQLRIWSQSNYGQNLIINPRGGGMYLWIVNSNPTIFDRAVALNAAYTGDITTPSLVNQILVSDASRFVITFGSNDPSGTLHTTTINPMLIRWSAQEDYSTWTPSTTNQAGDYLLSRGSQIVAAIQTRQEILVLTDAAIYSMQYLGPPYVWGFQILGDNISIAGPNAIATANNITYWMGTDKFYMYSGRVETLPSTLRQYVFQNINLAQSYQFFAGTNEGFSEIWWFYCSASSTTIDRYVIYNYVENTWVYGNMARTAWLDSALRNVPLANGYSSSNLNGILINHETGVDDGTTNPPSPIDAYVESSDFDIGDGHNFGFVWRLIPDIDFDGSESNAPSVNFTVLPRTNPGANYGPSNDPAVTSTQNYAAQQTYAVQQFTQQVYVRIRGRQMAFKISSGDVGVQWQLGVPRIDVRPDGRR